MPADETQTSPPSSVTAAPPPGPTGSPDGVTEQGPALPLAPLPVPYRGAPEGRSYVADAILIALALLLAIEVSIAPVRNHDLLMNLASGRDFLAGKYNPFSGQDPYSHTSAGVTWVNHSWLYDVGLHFLYQAGGVSALSIARAVLCVLLALVLIRTGQGGRNLWGPILAASVGILALSPRLLVQPVIFSFFFLALTLYFLQRGGRYLHRTEGERAQSPVTWKDYWPILVLFVVWVNFDEWFFLGPLTVALYAIGQALQRGNPDTDPRPGEVHALRILAVAGFAVCLINPYHVFAYTLPTQLGLSETAHVLARDRDLQRSLFVSGFHPGYFTPANLSAAHLAFYLLAVVAALSFAVNRRSIRWWRVLLAAFFFALSAWHVRAVPFFAVLAAPIVALNFQEAVRKREVSGYRHDPFALLGRFFGTIFLLGLLVAGWPGWLQNRPYERHRFALANDLDPALENTALALDRLRKAGVLPADTRGFHFSPEVGNALAFYAPEIKDFFDNRYGLFGKVAEDYVDLRRGLFSNPNGPYPPGVEDWRAILKRLDIDHVVLYLAEGERLGEGLGNPLDWLTREKADWVLLHQAGSACVFGNAAKYPIYRQNEVNFEALAYAAPPEARAPADGMSSLPLEPPPWAPFTEPPPSRNPETDDALTNLLRFGVHGREYERQTIRLWENVLAGSALTGGVPSGTLAPPALLPFLVLGSASRSYQNNSTPSLLEEYVWKVKFGDFKWHLDDGPPETLFLAIRAARRGLHERSDDYRTHAALGSAYYRMMVNTRERAWADALVWIDQAKVYQPTYGPQMLRQLRHVQAVSALESALLYRKDLDVVHARLAHLYSVIGTRNQKGESQRGFKDIELQHRQAQLKYARAAGPRTGEGAEEFVGRMKQLAEDVTLLEKEVDQLRIRFESIEKKITKVDLRAFQALELSLPGRALEILLESNDAAFGKVGTRLQIELGLMTGRIRDVHNWFTDVQDVEGATREQRWRNRLGDFGYLWMSTLLAAGSGDYARADKCLEEIASTCANHPGMRQEPIRMNVMLPIDRNLLPMTGEQALSMIVGKAIIDASLPVSESWVGLTNFRPPPKLDRHFVASADWTGVYPGDRVNMLHVAGTYCLGGRLEEAHIHFLRGLLALEQGDRKHAEEMLTLAERQANVFYPGRPKPVQDAALFLLYDKKVSPNPSPKRK